jgi:hypothetical protein
MVYVCCPFSSSGSIGNVAGKKTPKLFFSLVVTALYTYAPFSTLIWYREGIPYTVEEDIHFEVICPAWIGDLNRTREVQKTVAEEPFGAQYYMKLDSKCHAADSWCEIHPEIQGKYIDLAPNVLTYNEFEKCYSFFEEYLVDHAEFPLWTQTGGPCDPFNITSTCPSKGACGLRSLSNVNDPLFEEDYVCCHSGNAIPFESTRYADAVNNSIYDTLGNLVCADQAIGQRCFDTAMCENGALCGQNNTCVLPPEIQNETGWLGGPCNRSNSDCQSGFCWSGTCHQMPTICPGKMLEGFEFLGGFKLDPFCRTFEDWCQYTNLFEFQSAFKSFFGIKVLDKDLCETVLNITVDLDIVRVLDESDADIGYIYNTTTYNRVEEILIQDWAVIVLISIPVIGCFAVLAILSKMFSSHANERSRDYKIKCAATFKLTNVIENAMALHTRGARAKGNVMVRKNCFWLAASIDKFGACLTFTL